MSKSAIVIDEAEAMDLFNRGFPVGLRPVPKPDEKPDTAYYQSVATGWSRTFAEFKENPRWWGDRPTEFVRPTVGRQTKDEAAGHIFRREPFEIGNISGTYAFQPTAIDGTGFFGDLPEFWRKAFLADYEEGGVAYVVWSYQTVIGWVRNNGGITMPPVRYSNTTSQHQWMVARAFDMPFSTTESARKGKGKTPYTSRKGW